MKHPGYGHLPRDLSVIARLVSLRLWVAAIPALASCIHALVKHIRTEFLLDGGGAHGIVRLILGNLGPGQNITSNYAVFDSVPLPQALVVL